MCNIVILSLRITVNIQKLQEVKVKTLILSKWLHKSPNYVDDNQTKNDQYITNTKLNLIITNVFLSPFLTTNLAIDHSNKMFNQEE